MKQLVRIENLTQQLTQDNDEKDANKLYKMTIELTNESPPQLDDYLSKQYPSKLAENNRSTNKTLEVSIKHFQMTVRRCDRCTLISSP